MKRVLCYIVIALLLEFGVVSAEKDSNLPIMDEVAEVEVSDNVVDDEKTKDENIEDSSENNTYDEDKNNENNENNENNRNDETEDDESEEKDEEYSCEFTSVKDAYKVLNVQNYTPDTDEKENIYDTENIMRRDGVSGEAYAIFEIPYVSDIKAITCHRQSDVAEFSFMGSKDGENWNDILVDISVIEEDGKWTKLEYLAHKIEGIRYVKVIWGEEKESIHWWNPYFVGLYANIGESVPERIGINTDDSFKIPMYDSTFISLQAEIIDQIDLTVEGEIEWEVVECEDERIKISENNSIEIFSDMKDGLTIELKVRNNIYGLCSDKKITLCAPIPGDTDDDNIITETDIKIIIDNYGKDVDLDNRLCDVDKNGEIDVIDLAYAARYIR